MDLLYLGAAIATSLGLAVCVYYDSYVVPARRCAKIRPYLHDPDVAKRIASIRVGTGWEVAEGWVAPKEARTDFVTFVGIRKRWEVHLEKDTLTTRGEVPEELLALFSSIPQDTQSALQVVDILIERGERIETRRLDTGKWTFTLIKPEPV